MITAKNYAARAENELRKASQSKMIPEWDRDFCKLVAESIKNSVHFALPDGGFIMGREEHDLFNGQDISLPFDSITLEWFEPIKKRKVLYQISQDCDAIDILPVYHSSDVDPEWFPGIFFGTTSRLNYMQESSIVLEPIPTEYHTKMKDNPIQVEAWGNHVCYGVYMLIEFLEALSCRNVTTANHHDAYRDNAKRIKAGKLPIYETKMLVIDTKATETSNGGCGGYHASPRQHLRRGHIRRHPTAGNLWINSCVVGDPSKGVINKSYAVK